MCEGGQNRAIHSRMNQHIKPPTSHHFVPVWMSRRFTDDNGRLHFFDKRRPKKGLLAGKPEEIFKQRHLNSIKGSDGSKNTEPETKFFGPLDDVAAELVSRMVVAARSGSTPRLSRIEKEAWDFFFYHQWKRAPDAYEKLGVHETFEEDLRELIAEYERDIRPLTVDERKFIEREEGKTRIKHNANLSARMRSGPDVLSALADKGLLIARITNPKKSFVIGSSSVVKLTYPGRTHLADPSVEAWMPIAHDIAVSPGGSARAERLVDISSDHIRGINEATFLNSLVIAGGSPALIASLSKLYCAPTNGSDAQVT